MNNPQIIVKNAPFKHFCMSIGAIPTSYLDSLDYYETLLWLIKYLEETIIPTVNNNGAAVSELQRLYIELKNFVDNYFDNLDVQEEINNKLDEMAQSGQLATIINNYDILKVIAGKFNPNETSSNYTLLLNENKSVLIDATYANNWSNLKAMLDAYNITHLDCFILTHYDNDHKGNFANGNLMIDGYIDSETKLYLPTEDNSVSSSTIETIKALCEEYNLTYNTPYQNEIYEFANSKIKFLNCDVEQKNAYYTGITRANIYNTVCLVEHKTDKLLFMADGDNETFELMEINNDITGTVDFMLISHHGYDKTTKTDYLRQLNPKIALQEAGIANFQTNAFTASPQITALYNMGCKIISCFMQTNYVEIYSSGFGVYINQGKIFTTSNYLMETKDIYVDILADATTLQDGTEDHPFKDLNQAISTIQNYEENVIQIHLANGTYNTSLGDINPAYIQATNCFENIKKTIVINGNSEDNTKVVIKGIYARNTNNIVVKDLTIYNQYRHGLELYNTSATLENCIITNLNNATEHDGVYVNNGNIFLNECSILNANNVLNCTNGLIRTRNLTVNNFNNLYPSQTRGSYEIPSITYNDITKQYNKVNVYKDYKDIRQIYSNNSNEEIDENDTEIELPFNVGGLKNLKIGLTTENNHRIIINSRYPNSANDLPFQYVSGSENYFYITSGLIQFEDNKIKIANQQQIRISKADGSSTFSTWNEFFHFRIFSVWVDDNY